MKKADSLEANKWKWIAQVCADKRIKASAKIVAVMMMPHVNRKRRLPHVWPGIETLCKSTGQSRVTVFKAIHALEECRQLFVWRSWKGKKRAANRYVPLLWIDGRQPAFVPTTTGEESVALVRVGEGIIDQTKGRARAKPADPSGFCMRSWKPAKTSSSGSSTKGLCDDHQSRARIATLPRGRKAYEAVVAIRKGVCHEAA